MDAPKTAWLSSLAYVGFTVNRWLDEGNTAVTFDDVYEGLEKGTLWTVLESKIPNFDSMGMLGPKGNPTQAQAVIETLQYVAEYLRGRERRKCGIENNGLTLLLAFVLEAMQQEYWEPTDRTRTPPATEFS